MTEQEGEHHLEDHLFHGLRSNIHNVLYYMCNKPNSQYSKLVMAARKTKNETPGSSVSEIRAKSGVVEMDTHMRQLGNRLHTSCLLLPIKYKQ